nr:hypothetical protein GCM10025732_51690 [Glycomyces mayteni]
MLGRGGDRARKALFDRLAALPESDPRRTAVRDRLVIGHLELAMHIAKCYSAKGADETELLRAAFTGLVRAVDGFDPAQGDFLAYAIPSMMDEVRRRPEAETDPVPVSAPSRRHWRTSTGACARHPKSEPSGPPAPDP